ncbi:MAG: hypothetical protein JWN37_434 [Candidatus Nomurabacteria bacterium]|nr:hypothetical protein [Candidatus Nomurabacteria bacterium]
MQPQEPIKDIVVIYHAYCIDGFGAAWAAWKRLGDTATYIPALYRDEFPEGIVEKEVYILDFCFKADITKDLALKNKKLVLIDHHVSEKDIIESVENHKFALDKSAAKLTWEYFHPNIPVPELIEYISDSDMTEHTLPNWREVEEYIYAQDYSFESYDDVYYELEKNKKGIVKIGTALAKQIDKVVDRHIEKARLVSFEGYEVYACNAPTIILDKLGEKLNEKKGPFTILYRFERDNLRVLFRGNGTVDVSKIAKKYGGGGHHDSAGIRFKDKFPLSFLLSGEKDSANL